jgi:hypothetical protein
MVLAASTSTSSVTDAPAPIIDVGFYGNPTVVDPRVEPSGSLLVP